MKRLFFSQGMLDSMVEAGKIRVDKGILTMLAGDNPTFVLLPAYRIVRTIDNKADPNGLAGQIRSEAELKGLGAELYMDSVIFKEVAYQADTGFIAEKQVPGESPIAKPVAAAPASAPATAAPQKPAVQATEVIEPPADKAKDGDDLSKFILENLL